MKQMPIKLVCLAAALSISSATSLGAIAKEETIELQRYGVSFRAPAGWFVPEPGKITENLKKLDSEKENIAAFLASHRRSTVIATYLRHDPRGQTGMIPTINVLALPNPHRTFEAFRDAVAASAASLGSALRSYSVKSPPAETSLSGRRAVAFRAEYEISAANGTTATMSGTTYAIPCGEMFLQISMTESLPAKHTGVFDQFIKSFAFKEP